MFFFSSATLRILLPHTLKAVIFVQQQGPKDLRRIYNLVTQLLAKEISYKLNPPHHVINLFQSSERDI